MTTATISTWSLTADSPVLTMAHFRLFPARRELVTEIAGQLGKLAFEPTADVGPGQARHVHGGVTRLVSVRADEDPAPPDQEREQQPGQRHDPGDQRRDLARVVGHLEAHPLLVADEGEVALPV